MAAGRNDSGLREKVRARKRYERASAWDRVWKWLKAEPRTAGQEWEPSYRGPVEPPEAGVVGICCSGGGIRSAAFNLGALQRLSDVGRLESADYLAAVSGGSYIASAFSMVAPPGGLDDAPSEGPFGTVSGGQRLPRPFAAGSPEEQYLRNRTDYMAPGGMDKVILLWRFVTGAMLTFLFISFPIALGTFALTALLFEPAYGLDGDFHVPSEILAVTGALLVLCVFSGWLSMMSFGPRFFETWAARLLIAAAVVAVVFIGLPALRDLLVDPGGSNEDAAGGITLGAATLSFLGGVIALIREMVVPPKKDDEEGGRFSLSPETASRLRMGLARAAGAVFGPILILALAYGALSLALWWDLGGWCLAAAIVGPLSFYLVVYLKVDLTGLSMHRVYKRRLSTAFALQRERAEAGDTISAEPRDPTELIKISETSFDGKGWPTLLVCAAANVSDEGATPRGREVTSFTFSPKTVGGPLVGAFETTRLEFGFDRDDRSHDLTLPAAVAMSGAALAPSMGKLTKKSLRFLLTLINVRLGVWVPNPSWADGRFEDMQDRRMEARFGDQQPGYLPEVDDESESAPAEAREVSRERIYDRPRGSYLLRELLGRNYLDSKYLYVTDGGHYENLGLVELLRRGCTEVWCFDASGGAGAGELGDAVAIARGELGVEVDIDADDLIADEPPESVCVRGKIAYTDQNVNGTLLYCKSVMREDPTWDVSSLAERDKAFPNHSTAEQLYAEQRFEGYRRLGWEAAGDAIAMRQTLELIGQPEVTGIVETPA